MLGRVGTGDGTKIVSNADVLDEDSAVSTAVGVPVRIIGIDIDELTE
jgi:serine acetyltransferase